MHHYNSNSRMQKIGHLKNPISLCCNIEIAVAKEFMNNFLLTLFQVSVSSRPPIQ